MTNTKSEVNVALLGLGIVGTGVARVLLQDNHHLESVHGKRFRLKHILVNDIQKQREEFIPKEILTNSVEDILTDDNIQQSIDRSGGKYGNKGTEAAIAAIEMSLI